MKSGRPDDRPLLQSDQVPGYQELLLQPPPLGVQPRRITPVPAFLSIQNWRGVPPPDDE